MCYTLWCVHVCLTFYHLSTEYNTFVYIRMYQMLLYILYILLLWCILLWHVYSGGSPAASTDCTMFWDFLPQWSFLVYTPQNKCTDLKSVVHVHQIWIQVGNTLRQMSYQVVAMNPAFVCSHSYHKCRVRQKYWWWPSVDSCFLLQCWWPVQQWSAKSQVVMRLPSLFPGGDLLLQDMCG